jgi:hypothetical protein
LSSGEVASPYHKRAVPRCGNMSVGFQ